MLNLRRRMMVEGLMATVIFASSAAYAAGKEPPKLPITRDKVRLMILDNCVMDEWKTRDVKDRIADQCKCASARVSRQLSEADIKGFKDKLPKSAAPAWSAAMKYCLNPPKPKPPAAASATASEPPKPDAAGAAPAATDSGATDNAATGSTGGAVPPPAQ